MAQKKNLLVLSAVFATLAPFGFIAAPAFANAETSATMIASNQASTATTQFEPIAKLLSYPQAERIATTLYINKLPVLTFLNSGDDADPDISARRESDLFDLAKKVSNDFNTLTAQADFDAAQLSVAPQKNGEYTLLYGQTPIVTLNDSVFLADSTGKQGQDALIAVNRLRRILGGAAPIATIEPDQNSQSQDYTGRAGDKVLMTLQGRASWYGPGFDGRRTANGERFDQNDLTAAHKTLPFGTKVRVTNVNNGRSVIVRINDRGPYAHGREIDLSRGSAQQIGLVSTGTGTVKLEVLAN